MAIIKRRKPKHDTATGPGHIGYDTSDKFNKFWEEILGGLFCPSPCDIGGGKLYSLGAVLPFALVYF